MTEIRLRHAVLRILLGQNSKLYVKGTALLFVLTVLIGLKIPRGFGLYFCSLINKK
jgi:hypothetical protein